MKIQMKMRSQLWIKLLCKKC